VAPGTAGDEGAAASAGLRAASMLSPAAHSSSAVAARWLLAEAEAEAAALRAAAVAEAERVRSDAAKAVEETAASAERSRRQGVARTAELASGQMNVARSVLSAELRILDEDIREEQEAEWERVARRQREAEAEADRLLAAAEEKAVHVLAEARKAAEAAAEEERKRLMESVAADASREAEAARDLAMHQFHATRMLLSDELRVLDEEARERREEEEEKERARRRQEEEARVREEEEEEEARRRRSSAEKAAVPSSSSSSSSSPQSAAKSAAKVEVADAHFRSARRLLSDELRILDEEARDKREAEEEQARVKARQEEAERRREAEALRARASDEAQAVREQAEKEAAEMLRRAEEEARRLSASPAVPPPRVEHTTCAKDGRWGEPSLPTAGGPSYSPGVNPGFTTSNDEDVTAAEEDEDEGGVSALPSPQVLPAPMGEQWGGPRPAVPTLASSPSGALHPVCGSPSVRGLETTDLDRAFGQAVCGRGSTKVPATRQRLASSSTSPRRSASIHV
jgi:hypothetical protein